MPARKSTRTDPHADDGRSDIKERLDNEYRVTWSPLHDVTAARVDLEASKKHQARFQSVVPAKVAEYGDAILGGARMPWPILYTAASGKLEVADGIHRVSAYALHHLPFSAYLLDPDTAPQAISMIMAVENTRHGMPSTPAERLAWALTLIANDIPQGIAAGKVQADPKAVARAVANATVVSRIKSQRYPMTKWESLGQGIRDRLKGIGTDEGLVAAADLAFSARLSPDEVRDLVTRLAQAKRAAGRQVQIVAEFAEERDLDRRIQENGGLVAGERGKKPAAVRLKQAMGMIRALPDDDDMIVQGYRGPDRQQYAEQLMEVSATLARLAERLLQT